MSGVPRVAMGHGASTVPSVLHKHAEAEFLRVQARKRDHLVRRARGLRSRAVTPALVALWLRQVLEELLLLKAFPGIPLDFASLGVLFCMDARARGIVSLHELVAFTRFCDAQRRLCGPHQFKVRAPAPSSAARAHRLRSAGWRASAC